MTFIFAKPKNIKYDQIFDSHWKQSSVHYLHVISAMILAKGSWFVDELLTIKSHTL